MYNLIKKSKPAQSSLATPRKLEAEKEKTEEQKSGVNGLPICSVSGDSPEACRRNACISRAKVKHPDYIVSTLRPSCVVTRRSRSDVMYDKVPKHSDKQLPRSPQPLPALPPKQDPYEEQQQRAMLAEYRQKLKGYEDK